MKKYNNQSNVLGDIVKEYRIKNNYSKAYLSRKLQLLGIDLDVTEIKRIEELLEII